MASAPLSLAGPGSCCGQRRHLRQAEGAWGKDLSGSGPSSRRHVMNGMSGAAMVRDRIGRREPTAVAGPILDGGLGRRGRSDDGADRWGSSRPSTERADKPHRSTHRCPHGAPCRSDPGSSASVRHRWSMRGPETLSRASYDPASRTEGKPWTRGSQADVRFIPTGLRASLTERSPSAPQIRP